MEKNNTLFFLLFVFTIRYPLNALRYTIINFLILLTSFLFNKVLFLKTLFFLEDFFSFKCPVQALFLFICPFFVVLNRFIAPLWLLIFGIYLSFKLIRTQIFADYVQKGNSYTNKLYHLSNLGIRYCSITLRLIDGRVSAFPTSSISLLARSKIFFPCSW